MSAGRSDIYYELAELPIYTDVQFIGNAPAAPDSTRERSLIRVKTSVNDHLRNVKRNLVKHVSVSPEETFATPSQDLSDTIAPFASPSGTYLAVKELYSEEDKGKKRFVEVWRGDLLQAVKDVTKIHGPFYTDKFLSSSFSSSETAFVYTAEVNSPGEDAGKPLEKYRFATVLGEQYGAKKRPGVFLFEWSLELRDPEPADEKDDCTSNQCSNSNVFRIVPTGSDAAKVTFGQAILDDRESSIIATGYEHTPDGRFLGIARCYNRPSAIWRLALGERSSQDNTVACDAVRLTPGDRSCRSPRLFYHDKAYKLVYLSHELGGPHHSCAELHALGLKTKEDRTLVETVWEVDLDMDEFPGLYLDQLPLRPFLVIDSKLYIVLHSNRTYSSTIYLVSYESGGCKRVVDSDRGQVYCWTVLGTNDGSNFICSRSRTDVPNQLVLGTFTSPDEVQFKIIDKPFLSSSVSNALDRLFQTTHNALAKRHVEIIVIETIDDTAGETSDKVKPAIMVLHGGPHGVSTNAFSALHAALALEKYTVYLPNYTGSLGYGMKYVKELLGKCGELDVQDCIDAAQWLSSKGVIKEGFGCQFIYGGSHGGFLGAHLIGQYPTYFSAAVLRNPVINAGELSATTDIPDWCYAEFGLTYGNAGLKLSAPSYQHLYRHSPIFHADDIIAPVMLLMGEQDQRVTPSQGKNLYHLMKGLGRTVEMLWFPGGGHSLEQVESSKTLFEAIRR